MGKYLSLCFFYNSFELTIAFTYPLTNATTHRMDFRFVQKNTFNMRQITLENIGESVNENSTGNKIASKAMKMHGRNVVNAAKSLDLLRQNIQSAINNDIDRIIKKYLDVSEDPVVFEI